MLVLVRPLGCQLLLVEAGVLRLRGWDLEHRVTVSSMSRDLSQNNLTWIGTA